MTPDWLGQLEKDGYAIVPGAIGRAEVERLLAALDAAGGSEGARRRESVYAIRNLLDAVPEVRALAESPAVRALVEPVLGASAFPVRGILFDKTPDANWKVAWHQDLAIAVRERRDTPGFGPWSEKAGVTHVQPPPPCWSGCSPSACTWTTAALRMGPYTSSPVRTGTGGWMRKRPAAGARVPRPCQPAPEPAARC
jgi:hypothetical protein